MQKKKFVTYFFLIGVAIFITFSSFDNVKGHLLFHQSPSGDTSSFAANKSAGWSVMYSYLNQDTPDTVEFELIIEQSTARVSGSNEQLIGTITKSNFLPKNNQKINYALLPDNIWYLLVKQNGNVYLAQVQGKGINKSNLPGNPDVMPIRIRYKNN